MVQDDVDVEGLGDASLKLREEGEELPGARPPVARADTGARGDVEGSIQGGRAVPDIGRGAPLGYARQPRQHRLLTGEGLDLTLFVRPEYHRPVRRGQRAPDDVTALLDKQRSARARKRLRAVGRQAKGPPEPMNRRVGEAT